MGLQAVPEARVGWCPSRKPQNGFRFGFPALSGAASLRLLDAKRGSGIQIPTGSPWHKMCHLLGRVIYRLMQKLQALLALLLVVGLPHLGHRDALALVVVLELIPVVLHFFRAVEPDASTRPFSSFLIVDP